MKAFLQVFVFEEGFDIFFTLVFVLIACKFECQLVELVDLILIVREVCPLEFGDQLVYVDVRDRRIVYLLEGEPLLVEVAFDILSPDFLTKTVPFELNRRIPSKHDFSYINR